MELEGTIDVGVENTTTSEVTQPTIYCYYCKKLVLFTKLIEESKYVNTGSMTFTDENNNKRDICIECIIKVFDKILIPDPQ